MFFVEFVELHPVYLETETSDLQLSVEAEPQARNKLQGLTQGPKTLRPG